MPYIPCSLRRFRSRISLLLVALLAASMLQCGRAAARTFQDNLIVCIGDSLTTGYKHPSTAYPELIKQSMPGFTVVSLAENSAANGRELGEDWPCILDQLEEALQLNPEYIVFWGGTNGIESQTSTDAINDWKAIADKITSSPAKGIFLTMHFPDYAIYNPPLLITGDFRRLTEEARQKGLPLSLYIRQEAVSRAGTNREALNAFIVDYVQRNPKDRVIRIDTLFPLDKSSSFLLDDGIHLNKEGHRKIAELIDGAILSLEKEE